jgi:methylenetetrahydrofolate reductase (NADPH)
MTHASLAQHITRAYSLEVSAKDIPALSAAAPNVSPGTTIAIPYLENQSNDARLAAAQAVKALGFTPMLHLSARRIASRAELDTFLRQAANDAGVEQCLVIGGDLRTPVGPFADSATLIETGVLEQAGMKVVGIAGHPEGHPHMLPTEQWEVLQRKCNIIEQRGMTPVIFTQFTFDADIALNWLATLRQQGIQHPVRLGVPGPANVAVLARYAAMCGVSACASIWSKYGLSIGKLFGSAGPDAFVNRLASGLTPEHGQVLLHFFPFGGIAQSINWIERYRTRT